MNNQEIIQKIQSVKLCLMAHPDNEPDSEFEDRISDLQEIEDSLGEQPIQSIEEASEQYASSNIGENPEDIARKWAKINFKAGAGWQAKQQPVREKTPQDFLASEGWNPKDKGHFDYSGLKDLLSCYASSKAVDPQQGWVDVKTLPEIGHSVEVITEYEHKGKSDSQRFIGYINEDGDLISQPEDDHYGWLFSECVTYWRYLSEPPTKTNS